MKPRGAVAIFCLFLLAGCGHVKASKWIYKPEPVSPGPPRLDRSVVVLPFDDSRSNRNITSKFALALVPLFPYGMLDYETPEAMNMFVNTIAEAASMGDPPIHGSWDFDPREHLSSGLASELDHARLFREVFIGRRPSEGDFVIRGEILRSRYVGKFYTYGLSLGGLLLPYLGVPVTSARNDLKLKLALYESGAEKPLWTYSIDEWKEAKSYVYGEKADFFFEELFKEGMRGAIESLQANFPSIKAAAEKR